MAERTQRGEREDKQKDEQMTTGTPVQTGRQGTPTTGTQGTRDKGVEPAKDENRRIEGDGNG